MEKEDWARKKSAVAQTATRKKMKSNLNLLVAAAVSVVASVKSFFQAHFEKEIAALAVPEKMQLLAPSPAAAARWQRSRWLCALRARAALRKCPAGALKFPPGLMVRV